MSNGFESWQRHDALTRIAAALKDLGRNVRPKSEKWFALMSAAYVDEIAKLRRQIEEYCLARGKSAGAQAGGRE